VIIRAAEWQRDLEAMARLSLEQQGTRARSLSELDEQAFGPDAVATVATLDKARANQLIGFRYGRKWCGDVWTGELFLVHDRWRDLGIGTMISDVYFEALRARGAKAVITGNSSLYPPVKGALDPVTSQWRRPRELYLRQGYQIVSETDETTVYLKKF